MPQTSLTPPQVGMLGISDNSRTKITEERIILCFLTRENKINVSRGQIFINTQKKKLVFINKIAITKFFLSERDFTKNSSDAVPKKKLHYLSCKFNTPYLCTAVQKKLCLCWKIHYLCLKTSFTLLCVKKNPYIRIVVCKNFLLLFICALLLRIALFSYSTTKKNMT